MTEITTVGLDLAKRVVTLCGEDALGRGQAAVLVPWSGLELRDGARLRIWRAIFAYEPTVAV